MCTECGAAVPDGQYHPYAFCVLVKAGLDPWQEIRIIAGQVGMNDPGAHPPQITRLVG